MEPASTQVQQQSSTLDEEGGERAAGCLRALQITNVSMLPSMLNVAIELGVLDIIARLSDGSGGVSADEIAAEIVEESKPGLGARLDRMLCLLASHSVLTLSLREVRAGGGVERIYGLTLTAECFLTKSGGGEGGREERPSLAAFLAGALHPAILKMRSNAKDAVLSGEGQFEKANSKPMFEYASVDPTFNCVFNRSMVGLSTIVMEGVLNVYCGFEGPSSIVDVGGGSGMCLSKVVSKYPSIRAINFDRPHVIAVATSYPGVEHVGGDMFVSVPEGDAIMMKDVLHDWNDENCIKILKNCYDALPEKGKVIAINLLMPEAPDSSTATKFITQMNNAMMVAFGSHERTAKQFEALAVASGFSGIRVSDKLAHSVWAVVEFYK